MTDERNLSTADLAGSADAAEADQRAGTRDDIPESMKQSSDDKTPLLDESRASEFRERWTEIQTNFVDEPQSAVKQADGLVAETMKQLAETFAGERQNLEAQWSRGEEASTEDLRIALQRYRSFFNRLLSV